MDGAEGSLPRGSLCRSQKLLFLPVLSPSAQLLCESSGAFHSPPACQGWGWVTFLRRRTAKGVCGFVQAAPGSDLTGDRAEGMNGSTV